MHIQSDRAFIPAGTPSTRYLSVTIAAPAAPVAEESGIPSKRPGVSVSLVLDRSGSMSGRKISLARAAVAHAIRLLKDDDQLSVIVYDDEVETVLERMAATKSARKQALAALARIDARGSTNLSGGWFTGARSLGVTAGPDDETMPGDLLPAADDATSAQESPAAGAESAERVRRVLLLTDGLANQGVIDPTALQMAAARFRAQGVSTSTFGLGADFDEELLTSLASSGGGHFYFIEQPQQIPDLLASELGEVLDVVARDVVFEVTAGDAASVVLLNGLPVEQVGDEPGRSICVRLGDLVAEQEVTLVLAITCSARVEGQKVWVDCLVRDRGGVLFAEPMRVEWSAVPAEQDRQQPVNQVVLVEAARMLAERARSLALAANRNSDFDRAGLALDAAIQQLGALGIDDPIVKDLIEQLQGEKDVFASGLSAIDRKARHFASYAVAYSREGGRARKRGGK